MSDFETTSAAAADAVDVMTDAEAPAVEDAVDAVAETVDAAEAADWTRVALNMCLLEKSRMETCLASITGFNSTWKKREAKWTTVDTSSREVEEKHKRMKMTTC